MGQAVISVPVSFEQLVPCVSDDRFRPEGDSAARGLVPRLWRRLGCLFALHRRSASRVWFDGYGRKSVCKWCDRPMIKGRKHWRLMRKSDGGRRIFPDRACAPTNPATLPQTSEAGIALPRNHDRRPIDRVGMVSLELCDGGGELGRGRAVDALGLLLGHSHLRISIDEAGAGDGPRGVPHDPGAEAGNGAGQPATFRVTIMLKGDASAAGRE